MFTNVSESMGSDGYTEIQAQGWMSRLGNAFLGIPIGLILLVASLVVLFWNEGRSVRTARALAEGKAAVVSTDADRVDAARNGKLVHVSGLATTDQTLKDPQLRVSGPRSDSRGSSRCISGDNGRRPRPRGSWALVSTQLPVFCNLFCCKRLGSFQWRRLPCQFQRHHG